MFHSLEHFNHYRKNSISPSSLLHSLFFLCYFPPTLISFPPCTLSSSLFLQTSRFIHIHPLASRCLPTPPSKISAHGFLFHSSLSLGLLHHLLLFTFSCFHHFLSIIFTETTFLPSFSFTASPCLSCAFSSSLTPYLLLPLSLLPSPPSLWGSFPPSLLPPP